MGDGETDAVLAQLREHAGERQRREALKFVHVDEKVTALLRRHLGPAVGGEAERRDKEASKERSAVLADASLGQVDQEHLARVHHLADMQVGPGGGEDAGEHRVGEESSDFVLYGRCAVGAVGEREALELFLQKPLDRSVAKFACHLSAEILVGNHFQYVVHGRGGLFKQSHEDVAQDVLHADAPGVGPHLLEHLHESGGGEGDPILTHMAQRVVAERLRGVGCVEVDRVRSGADRGGSNVLNQIAMGVDEGKSISL